MWQGQERGSPQQDSARISRPEIALGHTGWQQWGRARSGGKRTLGQGNGLIDWMQDGRERQEPRMTLSFRPTHEKATVATFNYQRMGNHAPEGGPNLQLKSEIHTSCSAQKPPTAHCSFRVKAKILTGVQKSPTIRPSSFCLHQTP